MTLVLFVAAMVAAVSVLVGGIGHLARIRVRAVRLLVAAALLQLLPALVAPDSGGLRLAAGIAGVVLVALFMVGNAALAGVPLIAAGLLANVTVILANGAMPVSVPTAEGVGIPETRLRLADDPLREPAGSRTRFRALGDTIPVALPWYPQVVSPGDVLVASGVALMLIAGAPPRHAVRERAPRRDRPVAPQTSARDNRTIA